MLRKHAFTLVELLVVITIIALLIALLIPSLGKAEEEALSTSCMSNLREIAQADLAYKGDNQGMNFAYGYEFEWYSTTPAIDYDMGWTRLLAPYLVGRQSIPDLHGTSYLSEPSGVLAVLTCPATTNLPAVPGSWGPGSATKAWRQWNEQGISGGYIGSYGFNGWMYRPLNNHQALHSYICSAMNTYQAPYSTSSYFWRNDQLNSSVPMFGDCVWLDSFPLWNDPVPASLLGKYMSNMPTPFQAGVGTGMMQTFCIDRHGMAINLVFADGHGQHVPLTSLWKLRWTPNWQPKNVVMPQ